MKKFLPLLVTVVAAAITAHAAVVINEVYGGGGNSGAPFSQDYVELFNNGSVAVDIGGWKIQYGTATGSTFSDIITIASGTMIAPNDFYTVTASAAGMNGSTVPSDATGSNVNMATGAGKVQLLNSTAVVVDFVGYGATANNSEGAPAPGGSNTLSVQRIPNGMDTNNNANDFQALAPTPDSANVASAVPEPATWMLMGIGLLFGVHRLRRKS